MYLHLGKDTVVNTATIICILDLETTTISKHTKTFLKVATEEGFVKNVSNEKEIPKSYIICEVDGQSIVYMTNISTRALAGRVEKGSKLYDVL
ncbi:MAG: DUF370 domain-containing protein [Oscillospiraceae bacterium]